MTMMCGNCNRYGIVWVGPLTNLTGTKCPHCGGTNCQIPGEDEPEYDDRWIEERDSISANGM